MPTDEQDLTAGGSRATEAVYAKTHLPCVEGDPVALWVAVQIGSLVSESWLFMPCVR